ncbi:MAG: response regulator [Rhodospirillales bacterium]|nr:response regulator [Rhodospirillales bacterium]
MSGMGGGGKNYLENVAVLVVDGNSFMRKVVRGILYSFGCSKIREAEDGAAALKQMMGTLPDLILTEYRMTPVDGVEFTRMLRAPNDSPNPFIPIIMLSAYSERVHVMAARDAGINEFVAKPFSARALMLRIVEAIERPRPYIRAKTYFGPDRRRRTVDGMDGSGRRKEDRYDERTGDGLSQDDIDSIVAGDIISPHK